MKMKKVLAVVMSLCMVAGIVSCGAPVITQSITAQAAEANISCYSFDETTGTLTLRGEIDADALRNFSYKYKVKTIAAEEGTVFPEDSSSLFSRYGSCTSIDLSRADTSNVTNMKQMFYSCSKLAYIDVSGFDTSSVTDMSNMFNHCQKLASLDLSSFDTSKVTNMSNMFEFCSSMTTLDISRFDTSNVTDMSYMFIGCILLSTLDLSSFDTSKVKDMQFMFSSCRNLTSIDLSGFDTSNVTSMRGMFSQCSGLTELDLSRLDTSKVTDMSYMFTGCSAITSLNLSNFDTSNVKYMDNMFEQCFKMIELNLSGFDTSNVISMDVMFSRLSSMTTLDLSSFDTSNVKSMRCMFNASSGLTSLDLSGFDTSSLTDTNGMFGKCTNLTTLDLSGFDTRNVTDMNGMFEDCSSLTTLDLSSFDTSKVKSMGCMFAGCTGLTNIDVSGFDTINTTYMYQLFKDCSNLKTLDLGNFDTSKVNEVSSMFDNCTELKTITLGENFKNITADAKLPIGEGWVNAKNTSTIISGNGEFAVIENSGKNTYKRLPIETENSENAHTYPTNIKVEYSKEYHQVRFTWDKVKEADRYGIAVYLAGKWRVQTQNITGTVYTSPKNLTPGKTYKVAIAARVNGKWDTANAIKNAVTVTVKGNSYVKPDIELKYSWDLYVIAAEITMYLGPDTSYGKVTTIPRKTVLDELGIMNDNDNWAFTKYNGQYGWVQMVNEKGIMEVQIWGPVAAKPVIYLYPEKETDVHVEVELTEAELYTTYPKYNNGWDVVAKPDGSLVNKADGTHHRYLFWDAVNCRTEFDLSKGFCVAGSDTESFLKEKLSYMGLTEDEMNEFIVYWLPKMEHNKYNLISFQSDKYTDSAKLNITPTPDSMLRVFMTYVPLEETVDIEPQELSTFERSGFTVVEWGGSEL